MSLKLLLIAALLTFSLHGIESSELSCEYKTNTDWWAINYVYFCDQANDLVTDAALEVLDRVEGFHREGFTNSDVRGFRSSGKRLEIFPQGLENFFNNLEFIAIWTSGLKAIHREDLAPFKKLRILSIWENDIEYLEKGLLESNTEIEYIGFGKNRIQYVDGKVFNHLRKLHTLHFDNNPCLSRQVQGDREEVWDLVEEIAEKCGSNDVEKFQLK